MKYNLTLFFGFLIFISCSNKSKVELNNADRKSDESKSLMADYDTVMFDFEPDVRLFTTMAFANITGYDFENTTLMSDERIELRNRLDSILPPAYKEKISTIKKKQFFASIGRKAFSLTNPPIFSWLPDSLSLKYPAKKDSVYLKQLNEFYEVANIPALWNEYKPKLSAVHYQYIPYSKLAIDDIIQFCKAPKEIFDNKQIVFQVCPFMQNNSGFTESSESKTIIVVSPRKGEPGPQAFYHEALHHIVNPIVASTPNKPGKFNSIGRIGSGVRMKSMHGAYAAGDGYISECMVRTIDYFLRAKHYSWTEEKLMGELDKQYAYGFAIIPFIYEQLLAYEKTEMSLEEYFPTIIQNIDIAKEKNRWNEFQANI